MRSDEEILFLLLKVEKLIKRIANLKKPPEAFKVKNSQYKELLQQKDMFQWLRL